ncbi:MAG: tetratricopeptide repeat protein [bacterium]
MRKNFLICPRGLVIAGIAGWLLVSCQSPQGPTFKEQVSQALDHYYKGEELQKKNDFEEAVAEYQASLAISPRPRVYYRLAQVQYRLNQADQAVASLDQALKLSPGFREAQVLKQQLVVQGKATRPAADERVETAAMSTRPAEVTPPEKAASLESQSRKEQPDGQEESPAATEIAPEAISAPMPTPVIPETSPAPSVESSTEKPSLPADAKTASEPKPAESIAPVQTQPPAPAESKPVSQPPITAVSPSTPRPAIEPILKQGREAGSQGNWEQAQALYKKNLETYPAEAELWYEYGYASFQLGQLENSEKAFRKAVELKPDYVMAFNDLGVTLEQRHQSSEALQAYQKAVDLGGTADAFFNLALLHEKLGNYKASVELYEKYIGFDSSSSFAEYARQRIEKLRRLAY